MAAANHEMNMSGHTGSEQVSNLQQHLKVDVCGRV